MNYPQPHPSAGDSSSPPLGGESNCDYVANLLRKARVTASVRLDTPNFDKILLTWDFIVDGLTVNLPAIWVLFKPSTIKTSTSK